jgi:hypothetical protein
MHDNPAPPERLQLRSKEEISEELLELCEDYFEIAIGHRRPTEDEKEEARQRLIRDGLLGEGQTPEGQVKVMKYPLSVDQRPLIRMFYQLEYDVFDLLAQETSLIDGPFLPMLRYELVMQDELREQDVYDTAILRQSTFLETYFKTKMSQWKDSNGNFLSWEICIASAFRGEHLITEEERDELREFAKVRNRFAHDWRTLAMRTPSKMEEVKKARTLGSKMIATLYGREIKRIYENYSSKHISEILPIRWENRSKSEFEGGTARVTVEIACDYCGERFYPHSDGWKRCPECHTPHDWLERNS